MEPMDKTMTPKARFFVENTLDVKKAGTDVIPPGERARFDACPQVRWTPDTLTIVAFAPSIVPPVSDAKAGDPGCAPVAEPATVDVSSTRGGVFARLATLFRGKNKKEMAPAIVWEEPPPPPPTWELLPQCPVRLCAIELAGHTVEFTHNNFGPKVALTGKRLRYLDVAETLTCVLENTSNSPVRVKLGYEGHDDARRWPLGASVQRASESRRSFAVPPNKGRTGRDQLEQRPWRSFAVPPNKGRTVDLIWRTPWPFRATRIWCHSKDSRGELNLVDVMVGNRSQMLNCSAPIEMFEDGIDVSFDPAVVGMNITFVVENEGDETKHVEFELEGFALDDGPFERGPGSAPTGPSVPKGDGSAECIFVRASDDAWLASQSRS
jgi:hypothetical protein